MAAIILVVTSARHQFLRFVPPQASRLEEIDSDGLLVLDVSEVDVLFGGFMNDIRVEPRYVMGVT